MDQPTPESSDNVIRISKEDATSEHVDDLLKRQMSLRGEPGVTRDHGRKWYYQNWLVFSLVGLLGAVAAWVILEPYYDDQIYLQGPITEVDIFDDVPKEVPQKAGDLELGAIARGSITINGQRIWLVANASEIAPDGSTKKIRLPTLATGEVVGVYIETVPVGEEKLLLGDYLVRSPPPQSAKEAKLTVEQLGAQSTAASLLLFPLVAGLIGLFIGAADGLICRLPRRALISGGVGLLVGIVGGFVSSIVATLAYAPLNALALKQAGDSVASLSAFGFSIQMVGRSLAWCLAGMAMGLGPGIALRSKRLLLYGFLGGILGGLLGGLLFDPIDLLLLGPDKPSAHWSRLIGFAVIGAGVGAMIGVVELLARDAWLRMTQGPLTGKEFLLFKDVMKIGSSPRSDIYLFNDPLVAEHHATIRAVGDECEIESRDTTQPILLNNRTRQSARLRHGDNVTIGRTVFVFQKRKG